MAVLNRIKNESSRNKKEEIIAEFKDNDLIMATLNFLYNDYIVTGLAMKKIQKEIGVVANKQLGNLMDVYEYLTRNSTGSDANISVVQDFIYRNADSEDEIKFLQELFTKTYTCGATAKTINKALGYGFIPEFSVMLAHPYEKYADKLNGEFFVTKKLDGNRVVAVVDDFGVANFFTRNGKIIDGLNDIKNDIHILANNHVLMRSQYNKGFVLDGEITVSNPTIPTKDIFAETMKIVRKDGVKTGVALNVFDLIPLDEFMSGKSTLVYSERRQDMDNLIGKFQSEHIKLLPLLYRGNDLDAIEPLLNQVVAEDEEGLMINTDDYYVTKRTSSLLKVKTFKEADLEVVDVFAGEGKYKGLLGGIIVDYKGVKVGVGSGFTDEQRKDFWKNQKDLVGKIVAIQYFSESKNKDNDEISLRFPVFKGIRLDKTKDDVNVE